jgi:organic hydroperoxide reductase OsmC/OhrA
MSAPAHPPDATYLAEASWLGGRTGHLDLGNGMQVDFCPPPDGGGQTGLLTPEDAFTAAINSCILLMFLWACERFRLNLQAYTCRAEADKMIAIDRTEQFSEVRLYPHIRIAAGSEPKESVLGRARKALDLAHKYSLVASSIRPPVIILADFEIVDY